MAYLIPTNASRVPLHTSVLSSNTPVSPVAILSRTQQASQFYGDVNDIGTDFVANNTDIEIQAQTITRLVMETSDAVMRNFGTILFGKH